MTEDQIDDGIDNYETSDKVTDADRVALRYSDMMANAPEKIGSTIYAELAEHYSEAEIIELGAFIGFNIGYHTFFGSLDFYPMFTPDGRLVDQDESRRIYGDNPISHLDGAVQRSAAPDKAAE
ncbi:MAG: hypothetical protein HOI98_02470 [Rhodospirillaceae bacterium]|nr:hypothetical protein [Rhodospirillaceae bacterium]